MIRIARSVQLGPERRGKVSQRPHPHGPHEPPLQGRYSSTRLRILEPPFRRH